jgi:hypothetical protein|tara:strand:- start:94 stop:495 length:402 start_codon:yes stop_codon:yes gene_type:complete
MTNIEKIRCKSDKLYSCIVDTESDTLDQVCSDVLLHIEKKFVGQMSPRLERTLLEVVNTNDRIAKHALLFFSLNEAKELQEIFLSDDVQYVPPQKFTDFVTKELPQLCEKLLNGSYTSLRSFTEDCRWIYMTL